MFNFGSRSVNIQDSSPILRIEREKDAGKKPGIFKVISNRKAPKSGLLIRYQVHNDGAKEGEDFYVNKAVMTTDNPKQRENIVYMKPGSKEAKIYITPIYNEIDKPNKEVTISLLKNGLRDDKNNKFYMYGIDKNSTKGTIESQKSVASLNLLDKGVFKAGISIYPFQKPGGKELIAKNNLEFNGTIGSENFIKTSTNRQLAAFNFNLNSRPKKDVKLEFTTKTKRGIFATRSVYITPSQWDETRTNYIHFANNVDVPGERVQVTSSSDDPRYNNIVDSIELHPYDWADSAITLWEGSEANELKPKVSVIPINSTENSKSKYGFKFKVDTNLEKDLKIRYRLSGSNGFTSDDVSQGIYFSDPSSPSSLSYSEIVIPSGQSSVSLNILPVDDDIAEENEFTTIQLISDNNADVKASSYKINKSFSKAKAILKDDDSSGISFFTAIKDADNGGVTNLVTPIKWVNKDMLILSEKSTDPDSDNSTLFGISLKSKPTSDVTLRLTKNDIGNKLVTISEPEGPAFNSTELTFNENNWNKVRKLKVEPKNNDYFDSNKQFDISFTAQSSDSKYNSKYLSIPVYVIDDIEQPKEPVNSTLDSFVDDPLTPKITLQRVSDAKVREDSDSKTIYKVVIDSISDSDQLIYINPVGPLSSKNANQSQININSYSDIYSYSGYNKLVTKDGKTFSQTSYTGNIGNESDDIPSSGLISTTWSSFIYIPKSGYYTFNIESNGPTKFTIDGETVIDKRSHSINTYRSTPRNYDAGEFIPFVLDHQSDGLQKPNVKLSWVRPDFTSTGNDNYTREEIPRNFFSRVNGHHVVIPAGNKSAKFTVAPVDDVIKQPNKTFDIAITKPQICVLQFIKQI